MILGIDPGKTSGGVCLMDMTGAVVFVNKMPPTLRLANDVREFIDLYGIAKMFAVIEAAQAFPGGQGVVSTFNYGVGFGEIIGVLTALEVPYELVRPSVWTKEMLAGTAAKKGDKGRNIEAARRLFPSCPEVRIDKPHTGIIDALLISEWCRRKLQGTLKAAG